MDIHAGGQDLTFPHHENEIAQSECSTDEIFANYWMHNGYINIDNEKMSKSLGNFITVHDILKELDPNVLRFFMLSVHYRGPINFNRELVNAAATSLDRILNAYNEALERVDKAISTDKDESELEFVQDNLKAFEAAMDDDFNTANAITAWHELATRLNKYMRRDTTNEDVLNAYIDAYKAYSEVIGITLEQDELLLDEEIEALIEEREAARKEKNFERADEIRDELHDKGIILEDTKDGVKFRRG